MIDIISKIRIKQFFVKYLSLLVCAAVLLSALSIVGIFASVNAQEVWDGAAASSFAGGTGTKADPYLIENGGQLYKMVADYSNTPVGSKPATHTYFKITEDIDLNNKKWCWFGQGCGSNTYISAITTGFSGIVDGGGHTISNLSSAGDTNYAQIGLIPIGTQGAEVRNLTVKSAALTGKNVGGVIFSLIKATGGSSAPIVIENCSVEDSTVSMNDTAGGLVGYIYGQSLSITNCSVVNTTFAATGSGKSANAAAFFGFANAYDNVHNNTLTVSKSFCSDVKPIGPRNTDWTNASTFTNVYTSCESYDSSVSGITKLTAEQMTGINAKANMQGLSFNQTWRCGNTGEYPTLLSNDMKALLWDGTAANSFAGGSGTAADPYKISNSEELYLLANADTASTFGKYYELTNDIAISDVYTGWQNDNPYSWAKKTAYLDGFTYGNSFAGILDGAGYTVSGLYYSDVISDNGAYAYGLIPFVSANAVIKNINVEDVYAAVTGNAYIGAVAGVAHVTADDIQKPLNMVQFVGVNADDCGEIAILGGASRGVKFELCNADALIGTNSEKISVRNCNTEELSYDDDVLIYNGLNADSTMLVNIRKNILGTLDNYITDINGDSVFDLLDLVSAKKFFVADDTEETLVWSQEFDGTTLNYSVLNKNTTMSRGTTIEYADNAAVSDGTLKLTCADTGKTDTNGDKIYSVSYGLSTLNTMSFKYGRLEMRAKIPFGPGAFPSLWLTSRDSIGYNPNCAYSNEIDVFEVFGSGNSATQAAACIHKWLNDENGVKTGEEISSGYHDADIYCSDNYRSAFITGAAQNEWHTFVFEWDEDSMVFSCDGNAYYTLNRANLNPESADLFNQFLCININNHMYSAGDGAPYKYTGTATIDPTQLNYEIDYIRLYQKNDGNSAINLK